MGLGSARLVIAFACLGHAAVHILLGLYLTLVLVIERVWARPYDELVALWTVGALMVGIGAPLAGWLSDRFGEKPLMVLFFIGTGAASILAGFADGSTMLWISLALLGFFASIYHPVGLAWVIRHARRRGMVMGLWGVFGSGGVALASVIAGGLADAWSWQVAFILPGAVTAAIGLALWLLPVEPPAADLPETDLTGPRVSNAVFIRAFAALTAAMFLAAVFYHTYTTMLPKWLGTAVFGDTADQARILGIGAIVTLVYLSGSVAQIAGGYLTDRMPLKRLYVLTFLIKLPLPLIAGYLGGWPVLVFASAIVFFLDLGGPVENVLVAQYSPAHRRGLVYGLKFILAFVAGPVGVQMVAWLYGSSGDFTLLLSAMTCLVALTLIAALCLPPDRRVAAGAMAAA